MSSVKILFFSATLDNIIIWEPVCLLLFFLSLSSPFFFAKRNWSKTDGWLLKAIGRLFAFSRPTPPFPKKKSPRPSSSSNSRLFSSAFCVKMNAAMCLFLPWGDPVWKNKREGRRRALKNLGSVFRVFLEKEKERRASLNDVQKEERGYKYSPPPEEENE